MKIYRDPYEKLNIQSVVALGCFDGVHTGHANVISRAVALARARGVRALVWCFSEPPKNAYLPTPIALITDLDEKARQIRRLGADILVCPDFTKEIARLSCEEFVSGLLCECAGAVHVVCGHNYTFGQGGRGKVDTLRALCEPLGIGVSVVEDVTLDGIKVSSSLIREAVSAGSCTYAARLLGRDHSLLCTKCEDGRYTFSHKLLCVPEGSYRVRVSAGAKKSETAAIVTQEGDGYRIRLEDECEAQECRIYFLTNRQKPSRNTNDM